MMADSLTTKDVTWNICGNDYTVLNVPYFVMNSEEREYYKMDVTLKLSVIRDLMVANKIPPIVNFEDVADISF